MCTGAVVACHIVFGVLISLMLTHPVTMSPGAKSAADSALIALLVLEGVLIILTGIWMLQVRGLYAEEASRADGAKKLSEKLAEMPSLKVAPSDEANKEEAQGQPPSYAIVCNYV